MALYTVPVWKLEALWDVLLVLRRAVAGDPDTDVVRGLLELLCADVVAAARTVGRVVADLEKVAAVLVLELPEVKAVELPEVKAVAAAVVLGEEQGDAAVDAYRRIAAAWTDAGVRH